MKIKRILLTTLAMVLVAALSIAGTVAYLTSKDEDINVMTMPGIEIAQHEYERVQNADGTYEMVTSAKYGEGYKLQPFTQDKPLYPMTGSITGWGTIVPFDQIEGASGSQAVFAGVENVQDKFVLVENTGKSEAYVRTIIALEYGSNKKDIIGISTGDFWQWNEIGYAEIDGNTYYLFEAIYAGSDTRHVGGVLPAGEFTYNSLAQIYLDSEADNEDLEALDGNNNGKYDILVFSQATQTAGFANAETALDAAFGDITTTNHPWADGHVAHSSVDNSEDFAAAVTADKKTIVVNLEGDVTYDVAAWDKNTMGSENTETIVINGNGHTITFNQKDSDWNNVTTNGAKLVINNANITSSGYNNGPWNRHDLNFACDVELNNVKSDKAIALKAAGTLNNVIINDANTSDTYALWIQPNGQTVTLTGCTIDMLDCTDGRGIKIDEQYVDAPEKVTLVVNDTTFKTEEKSAILVKSVAGADVIINNVDISGVVADSTNAVWVDEASAAYADLVTVTGATKIVEP